MWFHKFLIMAKTNYQTIDEYISSLPDDVQNVLNMIRKAIREVIPDAEETISYQIPTFKLNGKYIIYFAGWKNHISVYPKPRGNNALKKELSKYKGGKGTVQFPLKKPIPVSLIKKIVKYRIKENSAMIKKK